MNLFLDSFWRAVAYCLHPRVIALSLLPLAIMVGLSLGLGYFFWEPVVEWVRAMLESSDLTRSVWAWLQQVGAGYLKTVAAPLLVIFALTPLIVLASLLLVAAFMGPSLARLVAERRFPHLERKQGGSLVASIVWSLGSTVLAVVAMVVSLPLWLIPPLILILPPLIWGWLTYRVMAFDALSEHASAAERRELFRRHRPWLLGIGVLTGYLGAAPSIVWASGALFAALFVILVPLAIWIYTLVFAFASLWFAHYGLAALERLRAEPAAVDTAVAEVSPAAAAPPLAWRDDTSDPPL
ncbi:MAG TPA: EI24 domain-containing protein [Ramlibacter sp.]|nr:EI24 domain-containing protein [Ramlibacter sp.]